MLPLHRSATVIYLPGRLHGLEGFRAQLASGASGELLAIDLRDSLAAIGEITGETTPDAILDIIFSSFCIGK